MADAHDTPPQAEKTTRTNSRPAKSAVAPGDLYIYARGYIGLYGPSVEAAAEGVVQGVPPSAVQRLHAARGTEGSDASAATAATDPRWAHHVTFVSKQELQGIALVTGEGRDAVAQRVLDLAAANCPAEFVSLGLGSVSDTAAGSSAYYAVLAWPAARCLRRALNLPTADMHVTVGFVKRDVHDVAKGAATLVRAAESGWGERLRHVCVAVEGVMRAKADGCHDAAISAATDVLDAWDTAMSVENDQSTPPFAARLLSMRATALGAVGAADRSLADADRAIALDANCASAHAVRGAALLKSRMYGEALAAFRDAERIASTEREGPRAVSATEAAFVRAAIVRCEGKLAGSDANASGHVNDFNGVASAPSTATCDPRQRVLVTLGDGTAVKMPRNFSWVVPGCLAGVSIPKRAEQIRALESEGVRLVVTCFDNPLPREWFEGTRVRNHFIHVENYGAPTIDELHAYMREVERAIAANGAVVAHCGGGKGRAGTLLAAYMIKHGLERPSGTHAYRQADWAIRTLRDMRPGSVESTEQENALRAFSDSLWRRLAEEATSDTDENGAVEEGADSLPTSASASLKGKSRAVDDGEEASQSQAPAFLRYPSTPHLPFSPAELKEDDVRYKGGVDMFAGVEVVVTEKLDGGNCCLKGGEVFARTHSKPASHPWFGPTKALYAQFAHMAECEGVALFGENMTAVHSIRYGALTSPFYLFAVRNESTGKWASWDEVERIAAAIGVPTVPVVFRGVFHSASEIQQLMESRATQPSVLAGGSDTTPEGFVLRLAGSFEDAAFERSVAKFVRQNHIQTDSTWAARWERAEIAGQGKIAPVGNAIEKGKGRAQPAVAPPTPATAHVPAPVAQSKEGRVDGRATKRPNLRGVPNLLVLAGLPGSGKSTFSSTLAETSGAWTRVCNDELRSKAECERIVGQARGAHERVVVDMCNVTPADRRQWLALSPHGSDPKRTAVVYFECHAAECVRRVRGRRNHPTIPHGRGDRIVESFAKRAVVPIPDEGFGAIHVVRNVDDAAALLTRLGGNSSVYRETVLRLSQATANPSTSKDTDDGGAGPSAADE